MKFILGKKIEMTQVFDASGMVIPVTKVQVGPCLVVQKKTEDKDGYMAVKCGFEVTKKSTKALSGVASKVGQSGFKYLREFRLPINDEMYAKINEGDAITAEAFVPGDEVTVTGVSKGKGYQGVVKRHGFKGGKKSHGHKDQLRMPGSIGAKGVAKVFKGTRMAGRMGTDQITVTGLDVIDVDKENNILYLKGAVPGIRGGLLELSASGNFEVKAMDIAVSSEAIATDAPVNEVVNIDEAQVSSSEVPETVGTEVENSPVPTVEAETPVVEAEVPAVEVETPVVEAEVVNAPVETNNDEAVKQ